MKRRRQFQLNNIAIRSSSSDIECDNTIVDW